MNKTGKEEQFSECMPLKNKNMEKMKQLVDEKASSLFEALEKRMTPEEMERIKDAFLFADEAHKGQLRKNDEPFIVHPIAVARIIGEELLLGCPSIIAALLHDVVEDTPYEVKDIEERFGKDVATLVKAVTKEKKENYEMSKQLDNFKQMLDSVHCDIRAILIKLADRLHNMRTLKYMSANKQMRIAGETDFFYAPLANKLGLYYIKGELQNLSLQYRCPQEYEELNEFLKQEEINNRSKLEAFTNKIKRLLKKNGIEVRIEVQYRTAYSLWFRMKKFGMDMKHMDSKYAIWVIYPNDEKVSEKKRTLDIYSCLTNVIKEKPNSIYNYIDSPKENGYQSFHVKLLNQKNGWEDVHISSERMIYNSKLGCVSQRDPQNIEVWINKFKSVLKDISLHIQEGSFIENVVSYFYNDDIQVFTPKGDAVILPQRATVLDFAYEIHRKIGDQAQYARINGKPCSVKTVLHRGDRVEIVTNSKITPKPDWLDYVLTYKAKKHLNARFKKMKKSPFIRCLNCLPIPGEELIGFKTDDNTVTIHKRNCSHASLLSSRAGESIIAVDFKEDESILYPVSLHIIAIDRSHLFRELTDSISEKLHLSMTEINVTTVDEIVNCKIRFAVHSYRELQEVISSIYKVEGVDEVIKLEKEQNNAG